MVPEATGLALWHVTTLFIAQSWAPALGSGLPPAGAPICQGGHRAIASPHRRDPAPAPGDAVIGFRGDPVEPPQQLWKEHVRPELFTPAARHGRGRGPGPAGSHPGGERGTTPLPGRHGHLSRGHFSAPHSRSLPGHSLGLPWSGDMPRAPCSRPLLPSTPGRLLELPENGRACTWPQHRERGPAGWEGVRTPASTQVFFLRPGSLYTLSASQVGGYIYSGSTGRQIGHRGSLGVGGTTDSLIHVTRAGAPYILFPCGRWHPPFQGLSIWRKPVRSGRMPGMVGGHKFATARPTEPEGVGGQGSGRAWCFRQPWVASSRPAVAQCPLCFQQRAPSAAAL